MADSLPRLSEQLEERSPSYEESAARADMMGAEVANAYTAGYYRATGVVQRFAQFLLARRRHARSPVRGVP